MQQVKALREYLIAASIAVTAGVALGLLVNLMIETLNDFAVRILQPYSFRDTTRE